ncbi:hypothetical protein EON77_09055 [bacterium]|nr:MAG: hypothetical protein EON77_09055 [bacterium]
MDIGVEISLYPLNADYIPAIKSFIERVNTYPRLKITTSSMSTQIFGDYVDVMGVLEREMRPTFERDGKCVFVMKVLGPFSPPGD